MNKIICILLLFYINSNTFAQCDWHSNNIACTSNAPVILGQSITCTPPDNNAGRRNFVVNNMISGNVYRVSNCGSGFDTQLTVRDASGNTIVAYNDDDGPACFGTSASLDFVCPSNGQFRIQLNRFDCQNSGQIDNGTITVTLISNSATICSNTATTLTASSSTPINWYSGSCNGVLIGTGTTISVNPTETTTYYATSNSWSTCMSTTFKSATPTNVNAGNDVSICNGSSTQLSGSTSTILYGSKNYYFIASGYDSDNFRIGGTTSGMPANATITSITYSPTIGPNCNNWYEWDLMINNNYIVSGCNESNLVYNGLNGQTANNQLLQLRSWNNDWFYDFVTMSVMFTINYSYRPNITYSWSPTTGLSNPNIANPIASPTTTTTYTMTATTNGCSASDSVVVSVHTILNAGAHNTTLLTKCVGFNPSILTFTTNPTGGDGNYSYQWQLNTVDITNATSSSYDPNPLMNPGVYAYRCKVTDGCGSVVYTNPKVITIVADPNQPTCLKFPNTPSVCVGTSLTLQNCMFGSESGVSCPLEFSYSIDAGVNWSAVSTNVPSFSASGTINLIRVRVSNCGSCNASLWNVYSWNVYSIPTTTSINHN